MQLVGAPQVYIRGPFVMEGVLQGGIGAVVALAALALSFLALRATLPVASGRGGEPVLGAASSRLALCLSCWRAGWWSGASAGSLATRTRA